MISAGGVPNASLKAVELRPLGVQRRQIRVANGNGMSVRSNKITLIFTPAMIGDMLKNAILPATNRAFGRRFSYHVDALAFLKQCGYATLRSLPQSFQKTFTSRMLRILKARYPSFKRNFDAYWGRFSGKAKGVRASAQAMMMYKRIHAQTQIQGASSYKCPGSATPAAPATPARPSPLLLPRPEAPVTPRPNPALDRMKLKRALIAAVRRMPKFRRYSDARAKGVLKYSWSMLKIMRVAPHILRVFRKFKLSTAPASIQAKLKEIVSDRKSAAVQPSRTPARPVIVRAPSKPRPVDNQLKVHAALIRAVRKIRKFKSYSDNRAKGVLRYSWTMLSILKVAPLIQGVFQGVGYPTAPKAAEAKLKDILAKWK